jgi:hypothetical protein
VGCTPATSGNAPQWRTTPKPAHSSPYLPLAQANLNSWCFGDCDPKLVDEINTHREAYHQLHFFMNDERR